MIRAIRVAVEALLVVMVLAYGVVVIHDFSKYADHYPYLATDDSLANVSFSLANEGRYGFMASPIQAYSGVPRHQAFANYGPWYFYFGAGLIYLFGYSFVLIRAIHLMGILAVVASALWWFGRRGVIVAGAILAFGLFDAFEVTQWPMIRPDIAVSVFAAAFVVAAGIAIERRSALAWFFAAAAAGCAAFSHLIAWVLVPCAVVLLGVSLAAEPSERRLVRASIVAAALGFAAAALMFYASFGFRIGDHFRLLSGYRTFLGGPATAAAAGYGAVLKAYLTGAFDYLTPLKRWLLVVAVALAAVMLVLSARAATDVRRGALAMLAPPLAVLVGYGLSLGTYTNPHSGYVILLHVSAWWCAAAAIGFVLGRPGRPSAASSLARLALAAVMVVAIGSRLMSAAPAGDRMKRIGEWVGIQSYIDHVLELIPARSTVWGNVEFGIESPERVQLIQLSEALSIVESGRQNHVVAQADMAPQYVLWSPSSWPATVFGKGASSVSAPPAPFEQLHHALPEEAYRLSVLVTAPPYGTTRVYAKAVPGAAQAATLPAVRAYDPAAGVWDSQISGPLDATLTTVAPLMFAAADQSRTPVAADRSVMLQAPTGRLLLRVHVARSAGALGRMLGVTQTTSVRLGADQRGSGIDFAPYSESDADVYLFHDHSGGALYVSQFDRGAGAAVERVEVYQIASAGTSSEQLTFWDLPPLARWLPSAVASSGMRATTVGQALRVEGVPSHAEAYQIQSPPVQAPRGAQVTVRTTLSGEDGVVCVGALNGTNAAWLRRDGHPTRDLHFEVDDTAAFRLTFYNCDGSDGQNSMSRFTISRAQFAVAGPAAVDRWMELAAGRPHPAPEPPDFRIQTAPPGMTLSAQDLARTPALATEDEMAFRAPIAMRTGAEWKIDGTAAGGFVYALALKPKLLFPGQRFLVRGLVKTGGITVGLQQKGNWVRQIDVTTPGEFIVAIEAPRLGRYTAVVAHYLTDPSLRSDVTVSQLGWIGR